MRFYCAFIVVWQSASSHHKSYSLVCNWFPTHTAPPISPAITSATHSPLTIRIARFALPSSRRYQYSRAYAIDRCSESFVCALVPIENHILIYERSLFSHWQRHRVVGAERQRKKWNKIKALNAQKIHCFDIRWSSRWIQQKQSAPECVASGKNIAKLRSCTILSEFSAILAQHRRMVMESWRIWQTGIGLSAAGSARTDATQCQSTTTSFRSCIVVFMPDFIVLWWSSLLYQPWPKITRTTNNNTQQQ